jgi:hypothetical protein
MYPRVAFIPRRQGIAWTSITSTVRSEADRDENQRTRFTDLNGKARLGNAIRIHGRYRFQAGEQMFDFNKGTKIPDIFALINLRVAPAFKITSESVFSQGYIEQLLNLSGDVRTTVELALLAWESQLAERMAANATYDLIVREFIDFASKHGMNAQEWIRDEVDGQVEAAKVHAANVARLFDNRDIVDSRSVRAFAAEKESAMLASWMLYRVRMFAAYEAINPLTTDRALPVP